MLLLILSRKIVKFVKMAKVGSDREGLSDGMLGLLVNLSLLPSLLKYKMPFNDNSGHLLSIYYMFKTLVGSLQLLEKL